LHKEKLPWLLKEQGRLVYLGVVEGDKVIKDQIIAKIEDSDIRAQLEQAKANLVMNQAVLNDAEKTFQRQKALTEKKNLVPAGGS